MFFEAFFVYVLDSTALFNIGIYIQRATNTRQDLQTLYSESTQDIQKISSFDFWHHWQKFHQQIEIETLQRLLLKVNSSFY